MGFTEKYLTFCCYQYDKLVFCCICNKTGFLNMSLLGFPGQNISRTAVPIRMNFSGLISVNEICVLNESDFYLEVRIFCSKFKTFKKVWCIRGLLMWLVFPETENLEGNTFKEWPRFLFLLICSFYFMWRISAFFK